MKKLSIFATLVLFLNCNHYSSSGISKRNIYQSYQPAINQHLVNQISIIGFNGTVYCADTLIDMDTAHFYLWVYCQEYHLDNRKLREGSGRSLPVRLTFENDSILRNEYPKDGNSYKEDIQRIFPTTVVNIINNLTYKNTIFEGLKGKVTNAAKEDFHRN